ENQIGASPLGCDRRHRGTHAERARFVARGRDDTSFARTAYRNRLAAQLRIVTLFDRCVERIHVDMDDLARHTPLSRAFSRAPFRPHLSPLSRSRWPGEDAVRVKLRFTA